MLLLAFSIALFLVDTWWGMLAFALLTASVAAASRIEAGLYAKPLVPVYVLMAFSIAFNWLIPGLFYALRILLLALASLIVCFTSTPTSLFKAFSVALSPLGKVGLPVNDISTTLSLSLRFMPLLAEEVQGVRDAQWARGAAFDDGSIVSRAAAWGAVFVPLFVGLFRRAEKLACAMDARCYGASEHSGSLDGVRSDAFLYVLCAVAVAAVFAIGVAL